MNASSYTAWNGSTYPWPPPDGWYEASDGRWWPRQEQPTSPIEESPLVGGADKGDDSSGDGQRSRLLLIIGLAALVVVALLVGGVMALAGGSDDADEPESAQQAEASPPEVETTVDESSTTVPPTTEPAATDAPTTSAPATEERAAQETSEPATETFTGDLPANLSTSDAQTIADAHGAGLPFVMQSVSPDLDEPVSVLIEFIGPLRVGTDEVLAENSLNDPPDPGSQFFLQRARLTILEGPLSDPDLVYFGVDFDGDPQYTFNLSCGVAPDRLNAIPAFVPQTPQEFNACWHLTEEQAANATYFLKFSGSGGTSAFAQIPRE